jgi:MOSC domain-containing protein YiiM
VTLTVTAVFVGRVALLGEPGGRRAGGAGGVGEHGGRPVLSGMAKRPVTAAQLELTGRGLAGDEQADLRVHGGPDKAVYVYPTEHYPGWRADGFDLEAGRVGENVLSRGADEHKVRLGDRWAWGTAEVQACQPRSPCYKLGMHAGRKDVIAAMLATARCGWYLRVLTPGRVPTSGGMTLLARDPSAPTIAELHHAEHDRPRPEDRAAHRELIARALARPELADSWRAMLERRLSRV